MWRDQILVKQCFLALVEEKKWVNPLLIEGLDLWDEFLKSWDKLAEEHTATPLDEDPNWIIHIEVLLLSDLQDLFFCGKKIYLKNYIFLGKYFSSNI